MSEAPLLRHDTDPAVLRRAFGCFPTGVVAVCAMIDGSPTGMVVSSFTSVSLDPPLVSISADLGSRTWPQLRRSPKIGLSVLSGSHEAAGRSLSARIGDRFAGLETDPGAGGALYLRGAAARFQCTIDAEVRAGDHVIVVLRVAAHAADPATPPLVFHGSRFHRLADREAG